MQTLGAENSPFSGNRAKVEILSIDNLLQLSFRILSEICFVHWKIASISPAYFLTTTPPAFLLGKCTQILFLWHVSFLLWEIFVRLLFLNTFCAVTFHQSCNLAFSHLYITKFITW